MAELTKNVVASPNPVVDSVVWRYGWASNSLTYGFREQDIDGNGVSDFTEGNWRAFYVAMFQNASTFTPLTFKETSYDKAVLNQLMQPGSGGQSADPYPGIAQTFTQVNIAGTVAGASAVVFLGQYSDTWLHEIGHSLGLRHSFEQPDLIDDDVRGDSDVGTHYLNSSLYTVMSYSNTIWGEDNPWTAAYDPGTRLNANAGSFMPIDIAALQHIYGADAYNAGNTVYTFNDDKVADKGYTTIWDTGGTDTIQYTGTSRALIDLQAATLQKDIGGGGFLSTSETLTGGYLIANGVTIENAIGGSNDDILIGNAANNRLTGNAGNDRLDGHEGADVMIGGLGDDVYIVDDTRDVVFERVGEGHDRIESSAGYTLPRDVEDLLLTTDAAIDGTGNMLANVLTGNAGANILSGGGGADTLYGGGGDDTLIGGVGRDVLFGGAGNDIFRFNIGDTGTKLAAVDEIADFQAGDRIDLSSIDAFRGGANDAFSFIGGAAYDGHAGQLRAYLQDGNAYVAADLNGDKAADLLIKVDGTHLFVVDDFIL